MIDLLLTYVNPSDEVWRRQYERWHSLNIDSARFRDWGTFKYWFRSVDAHMPWVRKIHILVSNEEQLPDWLNPDTVNIVTHADIMPKEILPTFNSFTIEMFFDRIDDLSECFVYSNDDTFVTSDVKETDFFEDGLPLVGWSKISPDRKPDMFLNTIKRTYFCLAGKMGAKPQDFYMPIHFMRPIRKSSIVKVNAMLHDEILLCAKFKDRHGPTDISSYAYSYYELFTHGVTKHGMRCKYIDGKNQDALQTLDLSKYRQVCVNDTSWKKEDLEEARVIWLRKLEERYPKKSKYEK